MEDTYRVFTRTGREIMPGQPIMVMGEVWELDICMHPRKVYTSRARTDGYGREYASYYADVLDVEIVSQDGVSTFTLSPVTVTGPGEETHVIDSATGPDGDQMILTSIGGTPVLVYAYSGGHCPQVLTFTGPEQASEQFRMTAARWNIEES